MKKIIILALLCLGVAAAPAWATIVNFESLPGGGVPVDDDPIYDQYSPWGVLFYIDNNGDWLPDSDITPTFEAIGSNGESTPGFINDPIGQPDVESSGYLGQLGNFFMKAKQAVSSNGPNNFVIEFTTPVTFSSGQIWDVDGNPTQGTEAWSIQAYDAGKSLMGLSDSVGPFGTTDDETSLNGQPFTWSFTSQSDPISYLTLSFEGTKEFGIGLAIDNLEYNPVPVPAAIWLLGSGLVGLLGFRRFTK